MKIPSEIHQKFYENRGFKLNSSAVFSVWSGSRSYGTQIIDPNAPVQSDNDVVIVSVPPRELVYGLHPWNTPYQMQHEDWDVTVYPISQFVRLLLNGNPSLSCTLWTDDQFVEWVSPHFAEIVEHRGMFSSLKLVRSFLGYARGQFRSMDQTKGRPTGKLGEKRKKLVDTYGYDTKNAGHLIRLLRMCSEYVVDGVLRAYRSHDADHLRSIRSGNFTIDEVHEEADHLFNLIEHLLPTSPLPESPDSKLCEHFLMKCYEQHWDMNDLQNEHE